MFTTGISIWNAIRIAKKRWITTRMNRSRTCGHFGTSMHNRPDAVILVVIRLKNAEDRQDHFGWYECHWDLAQQTQFFHAILADETQQPTFEFNSKDVTAETILSIFADYKRMHANTESVLRTKQRSSDKDLTR